MPILSDVDQELIKEAKISFQVPNPGFIFHNKLPKSGSTTMHNILTVLSQWNNFEHIKIDSAMMSFDDEGKFDFNSKQGRQFLIQGFVLELLVGTWTLCRVDLIKRANSNNKS